VHGGGVDCRFDTVEDFLVELCSEVAGKAMDLGLLLFDGERERGELAKRLVLTLGKVFDGDGALGILHGGGVLGGWVGQVTESEDFFGVSAAGVASRVDSDDVGEVKWVHLLLQGHFTRDSLLRVVQYFVPKDLRGDGEHLVGVRVG